MQKFISFGKLIAAAAGGGGASFLGGGLLARSNCSNKELFRSTRGFFGARIMWVKTISIRPTSCVGRQLDGPNDELNVT